jgi:hypothetical protein
MIVKFMKYRTIVETPEFKMQVAKLPHSVERLDEALWVVTWSLARTPECFDKTEVNGVSVIKTDGYGEVPPMRVFYKYDENEVKLLWIEVVSGEG